MTSHDNEPGRGAAESASGTPLTDTEREVSRPPQEHEDGHTGTGAGRGEPPMEPAEGSREQAEDAERRMEQEQRSG